MGVSLQQNYTRRIPEIEVITLCEKLTTMNHPRQLAHGFRVFVIGRRSFGDFALKGYDIVGEGGSSSAWQEVQLIENLTQQLKN